MEWLQATGTSQVGVVASCFYNWSKGDYGLKSPAKSPFHYPAEMYSVPCQFKIDIAMIIFII